MSNSNWNIVDNDLLNGLSNWSYGNVAMDATNLSHLVDIVNTGIDTGAPLSDILYTVLLGADSKLYMALYYPIDIRYLAPDVESPNAMILRTGKYPFEYEKDKYVLCNNIDFTKTLLYLGSTVINRVNNDFTDFNGYTTIRVYLPYYGYINLEPNDVMGKSVMFLLNLDIQTGSAKYIIALGNGDGITEKQYIPYVKSSESIYIGRIIAEYEFQLAQQVPFGKINITDVYRNMVMGAANTVIGVASAVTHIPSTTTTVYSRGGREHSTYKRSSKKGSRLKLVDYTVSPESEDVRTTITNNENTAMNVVSSVFSGSFDALNNMKITSSSSRFNPVLNFTSTQSIQILIYSPNELHPNKIEFFGLPCGQTVQLSTLRGFAKIGDVHIESSAFNLITENERDEIKTLLMSGVIL